MQFKRMDSNESISAKMISPYSCRVLIIVTAQGKYDIYKILSQNNW